MALFLLFSVIGSFRWFWMESLHKNIQFRLGFLKVHSWCYTFPAKYYTWPSWWCYYCYLCWWYYSKCDQTSDLRQQLELASELGAWIDRGRKWLIDFKAGKTHLVSFGQSNNTGAIDVKMDESFLEEKSSFEILGLTSGIEIAIGHQTLSNKKYYMSGTHVSMQDILSCTLSLSIICGKLV